MCSYTKPPIRSLTSRHRDFFINCFTLLIDGLLFDFSCFLPVYNLVLNKRFCVISYVHHIFAFHIYKS